MGSEQLPPSKWPVMRAMIALTAFRNPCSTTCCPDARYSPDMLLDEFNFKFLDQVEKKDKLLVYDLVVN